MNASDLADEEHESVSCSANIGGTAPSSHSGGERWQSVSQNLAKETGVGQQTWRIPVQLLAFKTIATEEDKSQPAQASDVDHSVSGSANTIARDSHL